jgi:ABC-type lipoprotein release transport system permease subunit
VSAADRGSGAPLQLLLAAASLLAARPARSAVLVATLAAALFWPIAGTALSAGLQQQARDALEGSAPLFVSGAAFGIDVPLSRERASDLRSRAGVVAVVPRIVGRAALDQHFLTIVALDPAGAAEVPAESRIVLPAAGKARIGRLLAERLGLEAGERLLLSAERTLVTQVEAVFDAGAGLGAAQAVVVTFDDATTLFGNDRQVSDLLVYCRPGYERSLAEQLDAEPDLRVQDAALVRDYLGAAYSVRSGALMSSFGLCLLLLVPLFLWMSDAGLAARHREIGILQSCGWSRRHVFTMVLCEQLMLALLGAGAATLLAAIWLGPLRAPLLRAFFVPGSSGTLAAVDIPYVLQGAPLLYGVILSLVVTGGAGMIAVWRSTTVAPLRAIRGF